MPIPLQIIADTQAGLSKQRAPSIEWELCRGSIVSYKKERTYDISCMVYLYHAIIYWQVYTVHLSCEIMP